VTARVRSPRAAFRVLVTCEHASCAVPIELHELGLPRRVLRSHRGWDPGALPIAEALAAALPAPLVVGQWSRLVADLNRSADHARVIAAAVDGRMVPGNTSLDAAARKARLATFWQPYRDAVATLVRQAQRRGPVLHLSVHSFTERLGGVERRNDVGLLFDPARARERAVSTALRRALVAAGLSVRFNFPYFGHTDGVTTWLRREHPAARYLGIELECNQRLSRTAPGQRRLAAAFVAAVRTLLG
jgi:predicted N-formylglutamate amidohydrolase